MRKIDSFFTLQYFLIREDTLENSYRSYCHFKAFLTCDFKQWHLISLAVSMGGEPGNQRCRIPQQPNLLLHKPINP